MTDMLGTVTTERLMGLIGSRGPRWAVRATLRRDEHAVVLVETAEQAESWRDRYIDWRYRQVTVYPPTGSVDLGQLGRAQTAARRALDEATAALRAGVLRALEEGRSEAEIARSAGISESTVRAWADER